MARGDQLELQDVPLTTRFRKFAGGPKRKVRDKAKVDVVQVDENKFGITIRRGTVTVKKAVVEGDKLSVTSVRGKITRAIKAGQYDSALFDDYDRLVANKTKRPATKAAAKPASKPAGKPKAAKPKSAKKKK